MPAPLVILIGTQEQHYLLDTALEKNGFEAYIFPIHKIANACKEHGEDVSLFVFQSDTQHLTDPGLIEVLLPLCPNAKFLIIGEEAISEALKGYKEKIFFLNGSPILLPSTLRRKAEEILGKQP